MASGIDWFRWHHGSVTDPKFQLIARKSGASLPDVLAVWAYLLEQASAAEFRGCFGDVDCEAIDCLFGFDDGKTDAILAQMVERKIIADAYIVSWEKRQPKRERENDNSTERSRAFRERQRNQTHSNAIESHETPSADVATPCNAMQRQETPREEESREEVNPLVVSKLPTCQQQEVLDLFAKHLPELPQPRVWEGARAKDLRMRWKWVALDLERKGKPNDANAVLDFFARMFDYIRESDFLMGRAANGWSGCNLPWIVKAENFAKIIEGAYQNKEAA